MSIIKYSIIILFFTFSSSFAEEVKKIGKFKDWEVIQVLDTGGKICFAQSKPVLQSPKREIGRQDYLLHLGQLIKFQTR